MDPHLVATLHARVVDDLLDDLPAVGAERRTDVQRYVGRQVGRLPAHLKLGVSVVALGLAVLWRGRVDVAGWERSRLPFVPQYVRMLRSLVLFAAHEPAASHAAAA